MRTRAFGEGDWGESRVCMDSPKWPVRAGIRAWDTGPACTPPILAHVTEKRWKQRRETRQRQPPVRNSSERAPESPDSIHHSCKRAKSRPSKAIKVGLPERPLGVCLQWQRVVEWLAPVTDTLLGKEWWCNSASAVFCILAVIGHFI